MPLNIKHQVAIALGTAASAVCLIGLLKSDSTEQNHRPLSTVEQLTELNSRLSDEKVPTNSVPIAGLQALPQSSAAENEFPVVTSSRTEELTLAPEMSDDSTSTDVVMPEENSILTETEFLTLAPTLTSVDPTGTDVAQLQLESLDHKEPASQPVSLDSAFGVEQTKPAALPKTTEEVKTRGPLWTANPYINQSTAASPTNTNEHVHSLLDLGTEADPAPQQPSQAVAIPNNVNVPTSTPVDHSTTASSQILTQATNPAVDDPITPVQMKLSEAAALQAVHHIEYGKSLSRRGAAYAAQQEFLAALRVIAQANDAVIGGNDFSKSLTDAIRALKEADDFTVKHSASGAVVDVASTLETHRTKLFTANETRSVTPVEAMQRYYAYAEQQLDFAGGRNVVTAEALGCLGKLHSVMARHKKIMPGNLDVAKAIVFHKTSLLCNPNNPAAANELGVLMAKTGQLDEATKLFKQSLIAKSTPQAWQNLAKTHHRLGESELARLAETELSIAAHSNGSGASEIQWIQVPQFNAMAPLEFEPRIATQTQPVQPLNTKPESGEKPKSLSDRIKGWF